MSTDKELLKAAEASLKAEMGENFLGKYGLLRLSYLQNHNRSLYTTMLMNGELKAHLKEVDQSATEQVERIIKSMAETDGTDEELKAKDQMRWVGLMNNYRHCAEEIILPELVYG